MNRAEHKQIDRLVSVVIPAYNAEAFIERTLESVLAQTHTNLEVVVINDGSKDRTLAVAEGFAARDDRVRVITTVNQGVAAARNVGIQESRGEFLAFVDADDLWHPTKISKQLAKLISRGPEWGAVYTLHRVIDLEDYVKQDGITTTSSGFMLAQHLVVKFIRNGSTLLVRREAAVAVGGFDPSYAARGIGGCEDLDFELRIAARYKMEVVPEFLVGYRRYAGNMSSGRVRMALSLLAVVDRCIDENPGLSEEAKALALLAANEYAFMNFLNGRDVFRAAKALATVASYDRMAAFSSFFNVVFFYSPRKILRFIFNALGGRDVTIRVIARKYNELDPSSNADAHAPFDVARRLKLLKAMDADLERKIFSIGQS